VCAITQDWGRALGLLSLVEVEGIADPQVYTACMMAATSTEQVLATALRFATDYAEYIGLVCSTESLAVCITSGDRLCACMMAATSTEQVMGPSEHALLFFATTDAHQLTCCCIQKLCINSGEGQYSAPAEGGAGTWLDLRGGSKTRF
jgi:hypothetical protein